jgi:putative membrane protein
MRSRRPRYPELLLATFVVIFAALGCRPRYPADWLLENVLVLAVVPVLVWAHLKRPFSNAAYTNLFLFLVLHEVGAHYTYSEVPYDAWSVAITGRSLGELFGWERNHYDRFVHFAYGLLLFSLARELLDRLLARPGAWTSVLAFALILANSALYELIEAGAAGVFGRDLGMAYLGTQGDVWDAHKDMAAACTGALMACARSTWPRKESS